MATESLPLTPRETPENDNHLESCPYFDTCDAPKCPLDALYAVRVKLSEDPECRAGKSTRMRLGADLPNRGLFPKEMRGIERYYGTFDAYLEHLTAKASEKGAIA